jgi:hypothetical protein
LVGETPNVVTISCRHHYGFSSFSATAQEVMEL